MSRNGKKEVLIIGELLIPVPGLRSDDQKLSQIGTI
jgi:hypothetical protein